MSNKIYKRSVESLRLMPEFLREMLLNVAPLIYRQTINIYKATKDIPKSLIEETALTKKQANRLVDKAMESVFFKLEENEIDEEYSVGEVSFMILYSVRSDKSYAKDVHQFCDYEFEIIKNSIEDMVNFYTLEEIKKLNILIEKYLNRFDKFRESKKYNGIWY